MKKIKVDRKLKKILEVVGTCPAQYWQTVKREEFPREYKIKCYRMGLKQLKPFWQCSLFENRLNCWATLYNLKFG